MPETSLNRVILNSNLYDPGVPLGLGPVLVLASSCPDVTISSLQEANFFFYSEPSAQRISAREAERALLPATRTSQLLQGADCLQDTCSIGVSEDKSKSQKLGFSLPAHVL